MQFPESIEKLANALVTPAGVLVTLGLLLAALVASSVVRIVGLLAAEPAQKRSRLGSLAVWWTLALLLGAVLLAGPVATATFFAFAALLGMREFLALTADTRRDYVGDALACLAVPIQFFLVLSGDSLWPWVFLPLIFFLVLPVRMMLTGTTTGYIHDVGTVFWGTMLLGFSLSHVMLLASLPTTSESHWAGWVLFLVLLTETNDIVQALWGRQFGRHKVTPTISPHKTWEGLLFGVATTVIVATALSPLLTPFTLAQAAAAGIVIAIGGFFGDINMSAVKRDIGVKDSSSLLPGQGGMLDRIDSLSFSAPVFYYYTRWIAGA